LNDWKPKTFEDIDRDFNSYIVNLSHAIQMVDELVPAIAEEIRRSPIVPWGKNLDLQEFERSREQYRFAAELASFDLESIEEFVEKGTRPSYFSKFLAQSDRNRFRPYIAAAKKYSGWRS